MSDVEISSVEQLLATALAAEKNAAKRYREISNRMQESGQDELVHLFRRMAESESRHVEEVEQMIQALGVTDLPEPQIIAWKHPLVRDNKKRATSPKTSTPYLALAYAVNNEELAFRFYSYVAANATDDDVRRFAEVFAQEELAHAALLRKQRRLAYHAQRTSKGSQKTSVSDQIRSMADLLRAAIDIETRFRDLLNQAYAKGLHISELAAQSDTLIQEMTDTLVALGSDTEQTADDATQDPTGDSAEPNDQRDLLSAIAASADRAFTFYDDVTRTSKDEQVMLKAQELTRKSLDRIIALGQIASGSAGPG